MFVVFLNKVLNEVFLVANLIVSIFSKKVRFVFAQLRQPSFFFTSDGFVLRHSYVQLLFFRLQRCACAVSQMMHTKTCSLCKFCIEQFESEDSSLLMYLCYIFLKFIVLIFKYIRIVRLKNLFLQLCK